MAEISADNKQIARHLARAFGGQPAVRAYHHDHLDLTVDLLSAADRPRAGLCSYGTIGLSDTPLAWGEGEFATRVELCGAADSAAAAFANVLASAAFNVMRSRRVCHPGTVMKGYVAEYFSDAALPHLYFTAPFAWAHALASLSLPTRTVSWLQCFPISDAECSYLQAQGDDAFETRLEAAGADVFDLRRCSVV